MIKYNFTLSILSIYNTKKQKAIKINPLNLFDQIK